MLLRGSCSPIWWQDTLSEYASLACYLSLPSGFRRKSYFENPHLPYISFSFFSSISSFLQTHQALLLQLWTIFLINLGQSQLKFRKPPNYFSIFCPSEKHLSINLQNNLLSSILSLKKNVPWPKSLENMTYDILHFGNSQYISPTVNKSV